MSLVNIALLIIVVGVLLWLVNTYVPMEATVNRILNGVVVGALVIWLLIHVLVPATKNGRLLP